MKQALHIGADSYPVEGGRCFSIECAHGFVKRLVELAKKTACQGEEDDTLARNARETMGGLFASNPCEMTHEDCVSIFERAYR